MSFFSRKVGPKLAKGSFFVALIASPVWAQVPQTEDLAALRYFISIGDIRAAELERGRLQKTFPNAALPEITAVPDASRAMGVDTSKAWALIEANKFSEASAEIERLSRRFVEWNGDDQLTRALNAKEGQYRLEQAFASEDAGEVANLLTTVPSLASCTRINNTWRYAELLAAQGQRQMAANVYQQVVASCPDQDAVIATLQKMSAVAKPDDLALAFRRAFAVNPANAAALRSEAKILLTRELAQGFQVEDPVSADSNPSQAIAAVPAKSQQPSAVSSSKSTASKRSGAANKQSSGAGVSSGLSAMVARKDWKGCLRATQSATAPAIVLQRSWCLINMARPREALVGFTTVAAQGGSRGAEARYGQGLAYLKLGQTKSAAAILQAGGLKASSARDLQKSILQDQALSAYKARRYRDALRSFEHLNKTSGGLSFDMSMMYGWAMWNAGRRTQARQHFRQLHQANPTDATRSALATVRG